MDGRSKSDTPGPSTDARSGEEEIEPDTNESPTQQVTDADLENLTKLLDIARDSVLAADCCITLLGSDRLTKQLYSEELITACLTTIKNQLTRIVYPFVEASCDVFGHVPILLRRIVQPSSRDSSHRRQLAEIFQAISSVVPRINDLICADAMAMSEGIIIQAVYIAIGPFFVVDADGDGKGKKENAVLSTLGNSAMRGLRLDALSLIRGIFANHEDQRPWIIEEILASLIKLSDSKQRAGQFRLRDGQSIRTVSALLLQLVQTSAHDVRIGARTLHKARQQIFALRKQDNFDEKIKEPFLDDKDIEEIRSGKSKVTKNTNEAEYRAIFDNLISDLLVVLFWPEWPAASLVLSIICKFMVSSLDDVKTTSQNDNNAAKTVALDHLGVIAAHLRSSLLKFQQGGLGSESSSLVPLDEVLSTMNTKYFLKLVSAHQDLQSHLCKRSTEDQAYDSARELTAVTWGHELALVLQQCDRMIVNSGDGDFDSRVDRSKLLLFGLKVKDALRNLWEDAASDVFDMGSSHEEVARIDRLSEEIGTIQSFKNSFHPILNVIVTSDPSILSASNVHEAIESHLLDSFSAVRDAAVELIGKYMIDSPKFASNYYQKIADRIADTGLGVRKRVIKLLKAVYNVTDDRSRRVDICTRIVLRMLDEDDTVKDLAIKTIEELWFQETLSPSLTQKGKVASQNAHDKTQLLAKVAVIMGVSSHFRDRQSPLEDLLHQLTVDRSDTETSLLRERYAEICEILIDGLVDASDLPGFTVVNCVRTIHLFTLAYPAVLSGTNASTLLPYLKNATTPEEQITSDYLLRIFRTSIPYMPRTAAKFGQELQLALQPMIIRPSSTAGILGLQETVACMCAVVRHITHDFGRVVALLRSCNVRLIQALTKPQSQSITAPEQRALTILLFIISLLCEHCNFDTLRVEHDDLRVDIDSITKGPVIEHVYRSLLRLYEKYADAGFRGRILQCLGFLFRAQPALMTADTSANIMDTIFSSPEEEVRGRLLKILQDFLISEATKHSANEKANAKSKATSGKVNMEELVGNTDGFADSGVSSAVVQRYLDPILKAALSRNPQIQSASVDILSFTIKQGLAHPLQSFPVIVALETSSNHLLSTRASALHTILHSKHTSLLNARYIVSARASFDYQKQLTTGQVQGYRMGPGPTALLQRWYSLVREKRASRQDFLRALVKVFDVELSSKTSQDDVDFTRYMAENFAAFEYKTQEEDQIPHEVIMDVEGMSTLTLPMASVPQVHAMVPMEDLPKMRSSVIVAMIMLLKAHLKAIYGLSEEKCSKWVMGKKSAVGDKAATRRHERPLSWERLPFATAPMLTNEDAAVQRTRFLEIWSEDGLTAEPEDELA
ncbi:Protein rad9 [Grifola frondosa]|uniref:Sister chromatid cohesion protein n=1 Tax=Grifola frondosa TaxID=5627 RepID=A0A1C7M4S2_GRIFR|nr:Protein rad9 [Grifola frondosa]